MAPSKKLAQSELPAAFLLGAKESRIKKAIVISNASKRARSRKQASTTALANAAAQVDATTPVNVPAHANTVSATADPPVLVNAGEEMVGEGAHQVACSVEILHEHSSSFFEGPIKEVTKTPESFADFSRKAANCPVIRSSTIVKTQDGVPMMLLLRGGMFLGMSDEEKKALETQSLGAIRDLIKGYQPKVPKSDDSRAKAGIAEQQRKWKAKGQPWGRYNLIYNYEIGQERKGPHINSDAKPKRPAAMNALKAYVQATTWEHKQTGDCLKAIDPEKHEELQECYQRLGPEEFKHLYQGADGFQSGLVLLVNQAVTPHKDKGDARDNWTSTNCWGYFEGGYVVIPELGIKIDQKPGDLVFIHAAVLTHFVEEVTAGERFCHVRFTKENIMKPPVIQPKKDILCPFEGCRRAKTERAMPSKGMLWKHLHGPASKKQHEDAMKSGIGAYHFLDKAQTKEVYDRTLAAHENGTPLLGLSTI